MAFKAGPIALFLADCGARAIVINRVGTQKRVELCFGVQI
jgi:hypothetical protein